MEYLIAQARQDPTLRNQHPSLHLRLVLRFALPRRQWRRAIVAAQLVICALHSRLVPTTFCHPRLELVRDDRVRDASEVLECLLVATDPVADGLRLDGLGKGVVRRAEHGDEELYVSRLAATWIDNLWLLAGEVD